MKHGESSGQGELFSSCLFNTLDDLLDRKGNARFFLIGCGQRKRAAKAQARSLYTSNRFRLSQELAETLEAPYAILSGLHGLLKPDVVTEPYDFDLNQQNEATVSAWASAVFSNLERETKSRAVTVLATDAYTLPILKLNSTRDQPLNISTPFSHMDESQHEAWIEQAISMAHRVRDLAQLYRIIDEARKEKKVFLLEKLSSSLLPQRGVYIFLDPSESNFVGSSARIVRIGTHAVSIGSKSTLRTRLRNHLGLANGAGNHRGSIFRLHVGRALLESEGLIGKLPSWGIGQDASQATKEQELTHEHRVSEYLRRLEVFVIPIPDAPSKDSLRAAIETQLIALCSENLQPIDKPNPQWLGLQSPMKPIVDSGLWNLRDIGTRYKPNGRGSVSNIESLLKGAEVNGAL